MSFRMKMFLTENFNNVVSSHLHLILLLLAGCIVSGDAQKKSMTCKETADFFEDIKKKLDTKLPIAYMPIFIGLGVVLPVLVITKCAMDWYRHNQEVGYIRKWEDEHLGENGKRNEVYLKYPGEDDSDADDASQANLIAPIQEDAVDAVWEPEVQQEETQSAGSGGRG